MADQGDFDEAELVEVLGGFKFNRYFALEAGFIQFGDFEIDNSSVDITKEANGLKFLAVGHLPLGERVSLFAGAGAFAADVDEEGRTNGVIHRESDDGAGFAFEAGFQFKLTDHWSLDVEYAQYDLDFFNIPIGVNGDDVDVTIDDEQVNAIKATITYRF